jgi:hypothetical protein
MADERSTNPQEGAAESAAGPRVRWDDSRMQSAYANVCNVASTREEVVLLFGINQAWQAGQQEIPIQLSSRIILSPHVAKRLSILLGNVLKEYETRFNPLIDARPAS